MDPTDTGPRRSPLTLTLGSFLGRRPGAPAAAPPPLTPDRLAVDQLAAETGIGYGVKIAKTPGSRRDEQAIGGYAGSALAQALRHADESERALLDGQEGPWYTGFSRGFRCALTAMTPAPLPSMPPEPEPADTEMGLAKILPWRRP